MSTPTVTQIRQRIATALGTLDGWTESRHPPDRFGRDTQSQMHRGYAVALPETTTAEMWRRAEEDVKAIDKEIKGIVNEAAQFAQDAPEPDDSELWTDVLVPVEEKYKRKQFSFKKSYCSIPLNSSVIYWNGDLGLCCCDYDNSIMNINIKKNGYLNTLFSKEVIKTRRLGLNKKHTICKGCNLGDADDMGFQAFKTKQ